MFPKYLAGLKKNTPKCSGRMSNLLSAMLGSGNKPMRLWPDPHPALRADLPLSGGGNHVHFLLAAQATTISGLEPGSRQSTAGQARKKAPVLCGAFHFVVPQ